MRDDRPPRIRFRQPVTGDGFVDAAWWPFSWDLQAQLPSLLDVLWTAGREVFRVNYDLRQWQRAPSRMQVEGRTVRLGGFTFGEPGIVSLADPWNKDRVDILIIAPETDPATALRVLDIASTSECRLRGPDILLAALGTPGTAPQSSGS